MLRVVFHTRGTWDFHTTMFKMRVSTFERKMVSVLCAVRPILYKLYINDAEISWAYRRLAEEEIVFSYSFVHTTLRTSVSSSTTAQTVDITK